MKIDFIEPSKVHIFNQFGYLKSQFIQHLKSNNYLNSTIEREVAYSGRFFSYLMDNTDITSFEQLTRSHILSFKKYVLKQKLTPDSFDGIKLFCKFLHKHNVLTSDPFLGLKSYKTPRQPGSLWEELDNSFKYELDKLKTEFLSYLKSAGLSQRTIMSHYYNLNYFFFFLLTQTKLTSITDLSKDIIRQYQTYVSTKTQWKGKLLGLIGQSRRLITVTVFCRFLLELEYIPIDVSRIIKLPKHPQKLPRGILTQAQIAKVLAVPDTKTVMGLRDKAILEILYTTGIRNFELRNLKLKDFNISKHEIFIDRGKGNKSRYVPTGEISAGFMEEYIKKSRPVLSKFNTSQEYLFLSPKSRKLGEQDLTRIVKRYCVKAGIKENITPHCIRHTCATHLLKNKAPLRYIQVLLGHRSIESTQVYTRVEISDLQEIHRKCHPRGRKQ